MNVCVFDTETTSLDKPFCYNIGYEIFNTDSGVSLTAKDFVVEQIWHNLPLFQSAYYADKREIYVARMKARQTIMDKFGYITQEMARDFKKLEVVGSYAFNSDFDERVFGYNCDWFKVINPFDNIPIFDIRGYVHQFISNQPEYLDFCEKHELFTESKNYSTTAEAVYRYLTNDTEFVEEHTALADSKIEAFILAHCVKECGAEWQKKYVVNRSIVRDIPTPFKIVVDGEEIYDGAYKKKYVRNNVFKFTT